MNVLFEIGAYGMAVLVSVGSLATVAVWMVRELTLDARGFPRERKPREERSGRRGRRGLIAQRAERRLPVTT